MNEPTNFRQRRQRRSQPDDQTTFAAWVTLAILVIASIFVSYDAAKGETKPTTYTPPSAVHYCTDFGAPPGLIQWHIKPATDPQWHLHRYPDGNGGFSKRGTAGMHTSDYAAALADLGYTYTEVDVRDAYCTRDVQLLEGGQAVRISGDYSTPFEPGLWSWGRRSWSTKDWRVFVQYNRGALARNMPPWEVDAYIAVILQQVEDAERVCAIGQGFAADPAAGDWGLNAAGDCRRRAWTNPGKLSPSWARPHRIELTDPELGSPGFEPGRLSTGNLSTDVIRR